MSDNRGTNRDAEAYVVSMAPDVCLTPMGPAMVPVPYTITCKFDVAQATATRTRFGGQPVFTMGSHLPTVQGDEPGTGGGLISGVNLGACRPVQHSKSVRVEGQWLVRHSDLMAMNCAGPKGTGNTYGKIVYIGVKSTAQIGPDGEIIQEVQHETTTDPETGETVTKTTTVSRDPATGLVTKTKEATYVNPETGQVESQAVTATTDPVTGDIVRLETASSFDPGKDDYRWQESKTTAQGPGSEGIRIDGISERAGPAEISRQPPSMDRPIQTEAPYDPTTDPEYQQTLAEQRQLQKETAEIERQIAWEAAKAGIDAVGLIDPTPISDLTSAGMSISEGDYWGAGLSIISVVPYLGDAIAKPIKATRMARKAVKLAGKLKKLKAKLAKLAKKLRNLRKGKKPKPGKGGSGGKGADGGHVPKKKESAAEKLEKNRQATKRKAQKEKIDEADAKGMDRPPKVTKEESEWLNSDPKHKELAYDPDTGKYKVDEAKAALKAESDGLIKSPVSRDIDYSGRGNEAGGDFVDGNGTAWDAKDARMDPKGIQDTLDSGENVMVHGPSSKVDKIRNAVQTNRGSGKIIFVSTD